MLHQTQLADLPEAEVLALSRAFDLLADPARLGLVLTLCQGERSVAELCVDTGLPESVVNHHVGLLRSGGVLDGRREGPLVIHSVRGRSASGGGVCELRAGNPASPITVRIELD